MFSQNPFQNLKAGAETVAADVSKAAEVAKADIAVAKTYLATAQADVVATQGKLSAFIKNNAGKIATGLLAAAGFAVYKFLF